MTLKKIGIIGLGYIGLPTAAVVASSGFDVIGVDVNQAAVDTINSGGVHIFEPGLEDVVKDVVNKQKFKAVLVAEKADIFLIAVPTPFIEENKEADLRYVDQAAKALAPVLEAGNLVVLESTSPIGTTARISKIMSELRPDLSFPNNGQEDADIMIAYCPERVLPGKVLYELRHNDRIIGGLNTASGDAAATFYQAITSGQCLKTTAETAEMSKLTENAFRDVNIAFANELSLICDKLDINVWNLIDLVNCHPRVNVLQPGSGVGGHCIAIDPWFIVQTAPDEARMIRTAREVNDHKPEWVVDQVVKRVANDPAAKVACFGLAFKPDIDDLRESPSLAIAANISRIHAGEILIVEPFITELPAELKHANCRLVTAQDALDEASVATFLVRHSAFADLDVPTGTSVLDICGNFKTKTNV
jgi:UDP-N-acetyl-D-mannosaminuronic acid dehydrogenase